MQKSNHIWASEIKAIGWDLDGTLYPPDAIPHDMIRGMQVAEVAKVRGWEKVESRARFEEMVATLGSTTKALTALGIDGQAFFRELWDKLPLEKYIHRDEKLVELFGGLANYRHFMISNSNTQRQIRRKLDLLGLESEQFEVIVSTDELGVVKPDPLPFKTALQLLKLEASAVLYVGDRVETDIVGAQAVGMKTCLAGKRSDQADLCIDSIYELGAALKNAKQML